MGDAVRSLGFKPSHIDGPINHYDLHPFDTEEADLAVDRSGLFFHYGCERPEMWGHASDWVPFPRENPMGLAARVGWCGSFPPFLNSH